jgi:glycine/D-amino acid oxidase-like deaminating enzyme
VTTGAKPIMTKFGSPWLDQFPKSRVPAYARQRGATETDVVVVGGGLAGCMTSYAFAAAGVKVTLVEAEQIGRGSSGSINGWIAEEPGVTLMALEKLIGARDAKRVWQMWRRASLDCAALLRRLEVKCQLEPGGTVTVAVTPDEIARLKREQKARRDAGIDAPLLTSSLVKNETGLQAGAAIRAKDGATLDPYRACLGLAAAAAERGAVIFERTPVKKTTFTRKDVTVVTSSGSIRANRVVITTNVPTAIFKALIRHFWLRTTYFALTEPVPAKLRQQLGRRAGVLRDSANPVHLVRWLDDRLMISGADAETVPLPQRAKTLVQRTGQLMYELSTMYPDVSGIQPAFGWAADYALTVNGLPCLGPHRNFPHHLFALGDASQSITGAYLASRVLLRQHFEEMDPIDKVFAFRR